MENQISILFDVYHLYHLAQFDPLIDLLENDNRFKIFFSTSSKNRKEEIEVNLNNQEVLYGNKIVKFELDQFKKKCLLEGIDDIGLTLEKIKDIDNYEVKIKKEKPWL